MSIWNKYPYTDFHELNLDWIIKMVKEVTKEMDDFKIVNRIVWGGLHDPGKEYPRFCIVDTPTHEGYISIQPVPAGITIDNEDYWRQVANYSALYADFQNRIVALESNVASLKTSVDNIVKHRRYIMIGDSYGGLQDQDGKTYFEIVKDALSLSNDDLYHTQLGGAAFYDANPTYKFQTLLENLSPSVTDKNMITDIIVIGGANDSARVPSDTINAISDFMTYVKANYPIARVALFGCGLTFTTYTIEATYNNMVSVWKSAAVYGASFVPGSENVLKNTTMLLNHDLCHPSALGVHAIGLGIVDYIQTGSVDIDYRMIMENPTEITVPNVTATPYSIFMIMRNHNGNINIGSLGGSPYTVRFNTNAPVNLSVGDAITLKFTDSLMCGYHNGNLYTWSFMGTVYDIATGKEYKATIDPYLTVANRLQFSVHLRNPIPASDNVTSIAIDIEGSMLE